VCAPRPGTRPTYRAACSVIRRLICACSPPDVRHVAQEVGVARRGTPDADLALGRHRLDPGTQPQPQLFQLPVRSGGQLAHQRLGDRRYLHDHVHLPHPDRALGRHRLDAGIRLELILCGVTGTSPANAWEAGHYGSGTTTRYHILILHWDGTAWARAPSPRPSPSSSFNDMYVVSGASAANIWAVGEARQHHCGPGPGPSLLLIRPPAAPQRLGGKTSCDSPSVPRA
jgi:hypothetical protein